MLWAFLRALFVCNAHAQLTGGSGTVAPLGGLATQTQYLQLDFAGEDKLSLTRIAFFCCSSVLVDRVLCSAGVLQGAGCPCDAEITQEAYNAKCSTCSESDYGTCRSVDGGSFASVGSHLMDHAI
jgi:hypothetical protein